MKPTRTVRLFLTLILLSSLGLYSRSACAQDWQWKATIEVGESPERAALTQDGLNLYVANRRSCDVSIVDVLTGKVTATIGFGKSPRAIVASHDGQRVYVLVEDASPGKGSCSAAALDTEHGHKLAIINTASKAVSYIALPGERWDEMVLTHDDRHLYLTQVVEGPGWGAVYSFDTITGQLQRVIRDQGCPVGIAISEQEERLYVNYQCYGPFGDPSHPARDSIGVYELLSPYRRIAVISGLPNVGGPLALSPDGSQLWADGNDACSRPDYQTVNKGLPEACPGFPLRVVNVIATSDWYVHSFGFSLEDFNGRISFSPEGDAFVGGGIYLKEFPHQKETGSPSLKVVNRLPLANVGDVAFRRAGRTEYMYAAVSDKNLIYVMERANREIADDPATTEYLPISLLQADNRTGRVLVTEKKNVDELPTHDKLADAPGYAPVSKLTLATVYSLLSMDSNYGRCASDKSCIRVPPKVMVPVLSKRAGGVLSQGCGQEKPTQSIIYRCVANVILSAAASGGMDQRNGISQALELQALDTNENYLNFKMGLIAMHEELTRLHAKKSSELTPKERQDLPALPEKIKKAEHDSRSFNDVTTRLSGPSTLQSSLGDSAIALDVFSSGDRTFTVLISDHEQVLQEDTYMGRLVSRNTLETTADAFLTKLYGSRSPSPPAEAKYLYDVLIGDGKVSDKLHEISPHTLLWVTDGELSSIPMAALSRDGKEYLVASYSHVVLTRPAAPSDTAASAELKGLAGGTSRSADVLVKEGTYHLPEQGELKNLPRLFADQQPAIPTTVLLDANFTKKHLSTALTELEENRNHHKLFVHLASHFALFADEESSFLLTGDRENPYLTLRDLTCVDDPQCPYRFPLRGVDLVTFSACQTGAGRSHAGERIESLAFHLDERGNGAHAVLATLWPIEPTSANRLLKRFYAGMQKGLPKAEALRQAELSLFQEHLPARQWAAFVLIGDWH